MKILRQVIPLFVLFLISAILFTGCNQVRKPTADAVENKKTERLMNEAIKQVDLPAIVNFQEKKDLKKLYELRDNPKLICYAYTVSLDGSKKFLTKCRGYGIPYSTQFSNPEKAVELDRILARSIGGYHLATMPQPEPNGLFMPEGLSATWIIAIGPDNKEYPMYVEPSIIVSPFKLY